MSEVGVSLTSFVDFTLRPDSMKPAFVRDLKRRIYTPGSDYWRIMRDEITDMFRNNHDVSFLDSAISRTSKDRVPNYLSAKKGMSKFLSKNKNIIWFDPPGGVWTQDKLGVNVNPEVGLLINGIPHIVKLYFKGKTAPQGVLLNAPRGRTIAWLMLDTLLDNSHSGTVMAILDVVNGKLVTPKPDQNTELATRCCALTFTNMWLAL